MEAVMPLRTCRLSALGATRWFTGAGPTTDILVLRLMMGIISKNAPFGSFGKDAKCDSCQRPADAYWNFQGGKDVFICFFCAVRDLPKLIADSIFSRTAFENEIGFDPEDQSLTQLKRFCTDQQNSHHLRWRSQQIEIMKKNFLLAARYAAENENSYIKKYVERIPITNSSASNEISN